ncbi:MAG TPA: hypothetical protein PKI89_05535 [Tepidiformaceae bacterium]|nr:hypothetical protein [Tepidiformaceae bacterium]
MHIENGLQAQVARQFIERRDSMLQALASRIKTPAGEQGTPPAASLAGDEVLLSPEARAAAWQLRLVEPGGYPGLPAPDRIVAALRAVFEAPPGTDLREPLAALRTLLAQLARNFPGDAPAGAAPSQPAADIVRLLLGEPGRGLLPAASRFDPAAVASAVRALLAQAGLAAAGNPSPFERAAAALLAAVLTWREGAPGQPYANPATHQPGDLPAALLSLAGAPTRLPKRRRAGRGSTDEHEWAPPDNEDESSMPERWQGSEAGPAAT